MLAPRHRWRARVAAQSPSSAKACRAAIDALRDAGGFDPELGARPMRRAIGRHIEAPIAEMILKGMLSRGDVATVDVEGGASVVDAVTPPPEEARSAR